MMSASNEKLQGYTHAQKDKWTEIQEIKIYNITDSHIIQVFKY